jgi:hypothetical protein
MDELAVLLEAPITITRTFKLGDYKNLKVNVIPNELDKETKWRMMLENALDAYEQLFAHQLITAELYDGDVGFWEAKQTKLLELKTRLLQEE